MDRIDAKSKFIAKSEFITVYREKRTRHFPVVFNKHEGHELVMVESGMCRALVENRKYLLKKSDVLLIAEGEYHAVQVPGECAFLYIDFRPGLIFSSQEMLGLFLRPFYSGQNGGSHKFQGTDDLSACILDLARTLRPQNDLVAVLKSVLDFVDYFKRLKTPAKKDAVQPWREKIKPALDLLYQHYSEEISIERMALACSLSRPTFYRVFTRAVRKRPVELLNEIRLEQAATLLTTTRRKISDIAASTGFLNLSYFNRQFRKAFGKPPLQYRKKAVAFIK